MRKIFVLLLILASCTVVGQQESDSLYQRCPVFVTDTLTSNNFFLEFQPALVKLYRTRGRLTIVIQQKDQYFTIFFNERKLENEDYKIVVGETRKDDEVEAKYSFRSGSSASYVSVSKGTVHASLDKEKGLWHIRVNGLLSNLAANTVSYYRVRADFHVRDK